MKNIVLFLWRDRRSVLAICCFVPTEISHSFEKFGFEFILHSAFLSRQECYAGVQRIHKV